MYLTCLKTFIVFTFCNLVIQFRYFTTYYIVVGFSSKTDRAASKVFLSLHSCMIDSFIPQSIRVEVLNSFEPTPPKHKTHVSIQFISFQYLYLTYNLTNKNMFI